MLSAMVASTGGRRQPEEPRRGQRQRQAVRRGERGDRLPQPPPRRRQQHQRQHERQVVEPGQDVLDAEAQVRARDGARGRRRRHQPVGVARPGAGRAVRCWCGRRWWRPAPAPRCQRRPRTARQAGRPASPPGTCTRNRSTDIVPKRGSRRAARVARCPAGKIGAGGLLQRRLDRHAKSTSYCSRADLGHGQQRGPQIVRARRRRRQRERHRQRRQRDPRPAARVIAPVQERRQRRARSRASAAARAAARSGSAAAG